MGNKTFTEIYLYHEIKIPNIIKQVYKNKWMGKISHRFLVKYKVCIIITRLLALFRRDKKK